MYKKTTQSWLKHIDFCIIDVICLELSLIVANALRFRSESGIPNLYLYQDTALVAIFISIFVSIFFDTHKDILKKSIYADFLSSLKQAVVVIFVLLFYLYATHKSDMYSRIAFFASFFIYLFLGFIVKEIWKRFLIKRSKHNGKRSLLIITQENEAEDCIENLKNTSYEIFRIAGFAIMDNNRTGSEIAGYKVVAGLPDVVDYIGNEWIDEVFIDLPDDKERQDTLSRRISKMGVVVHTWLTTEKELVGEKKFVERIGNCVVMTTTMNYASTWQLFLKRVMDIIGGVIGLAVTGVLFCVLAPVIRVKSPGPIFFRQERVGRNGKKFKIYKFRTMYLDAEERKKELMEQNKIKDGRMFKLDFDPRIIGNEILEDGTHKTGFMDKCRRLSLDEFPQFLNVLKGEMSIVGTRPPTVREYEIYKPHHHARLAAKPGITGLWQISGRSNIVDFEEVVRLDTRYINEWNLGLDIKIICKTIVVVLKKSGAL